MITDEQREKLRGWFAGRLPDDLFEELVEVTVDREEITVTLPGYAFCNSASNSDLIWSPPLARQSLTS